MTRKEFVSALRSQTEDIRLSPQLRRQIIDAAYGKEQKIMKRKIPVIALAVVLSLLCCAVALAAAGRAGMLDYLSQFAYIYIPENAQENIETNVLETGSDALDISVRELYYDGLTARLTVDVKPKDDKVMLIGFDTLVTDSWSGVNRMNPDFDASDTRTIQEVFRDEGYTTGYVVSANLFAPDGQGVGSSGDYSITEEGVLTFFLQKKFAKNAEKRDVTFRVAVTPAIGADGEALKADADQRVFIEQQLTLSSAAKIQEVYVNEAPVVLEKTGITVEHFMVEVKPQELYVTWIYTQEETELSSQPAFGNADLYGTIGEYFTLELIDPESLSEELHEQRLPSGPSGTVNSLKLSAEGETPERYMSIFSIALNELHDSYTLRVFDYAAKERYESAVVSMREATEADVALISGYSSIE